MKSESQTNRVSQSDHESIGEWMAIQWIMMTTPCNRPSSLTTPGLIIRKLMTTTIVLNRFPWSVSRLVCFLFTNYCLSAIKREGGRDSAIRAKCHWTGGNLETEHCCGNQHSMTNHEWMLHTADCRCSNFRTRFVLVVDDWVDHRQSGHAIEKHSVHWSKCARDKCMHVTTNGQSVRTFAIHPSIQATFLAYLLLMNWIILANSQPVRVDNCHCGGQCDKLPYIQCNGMSA